MSMSVTILTPTGHKKIIKVTPNTSILQILEDVCKKQGYSPEEHDLRHCNKILDLSNNVRFANLPNNAQLELVRAIKSRTETKVTVGLQLEDGERIKGDFKPSQTIWDILNYWNEKRNGTLLESINVSGEPLEPLCVYMRREMVGEAQLKTTTLRSLGLTGGNAIIRLMHRPIGHTVEQRHVEALILSSKISSDSNKPKTSYHDESPSTSGLGNSNAVSWPTTSDWGLTKEQNMARIDESPTTSAWTSPSSQPLPKTDTKFVSLHETTYKPVDVVKQTDDPVKTDVAECESEVPHVSDGTSAMEIDECHEEKLNFLDDRGSLLYSLDQVASPVYDDIPDEFFEVTIDDVKMLMEDYRKKRTELEDIPLQTSALREAAYLTRLNKYPKAVIRIVFPDRLVLQGSFKAVDTVESVINFIWQFIVDGITDFHLFITPPKRNLKPDERLFEIPLVPTAVVHFGCDFPKDHYLIKEVREKISSAAAVNRASFNRKQNRPVVSKPEVMSSSSTGIDDTQGSLASSSSESQQSHTVNKSTGAIPKWFAQNSKRNPR